MSALSITDIPSLLVMTTAHTFLALFSVVSASIPARLVATLTVSLQSPYRLLLPVLVTRVPFLGLSLINGFLARSA